MIAIGIGCLGHGLDLEAGGIADVHVDVLLDEFLQIRRGRNA